MVIPGKRKAGISALLACTAIAGLLAAPGSWGADVNAVVGTCANCHGNDGASSESDVPIIAGYSSDYLAGAMAAYQKKERPCPETKIRSGDKKGTSSDMCQSVKDLSDADIDKVARYFAGKKFVRAVQSFDPALAAKGKELHESTCEKCHLEAGTVPSDDAGILAGQWMPYLRTQFEDFKAGKRLIPQKMKPKIDKLDNAAIEGLLNFYGSFK